MDGVMEEHQPASGPFRDPPPFTVETAGHAFGFYAGGPDRLARLLRLVDEAQGSLRIVFYIYEPDESGTRLRDALVAAARRGVAVTLILDGFGASADAAFFAPLIEAGGRYVCFQARWSRRYLIRNHQKIVLVDGRIAMLGGFNISDSYFALPEGEAWSDLAFTVEGPVVARIADWFQELESWSAAEKGQFRAIRRSVREWDAGRGPVRLLVGGPTTGLSSWARVVSEDLIYGKRLTMIMAYFSPPRRLLRRIRRIAQMGKATLLLPSRSDNAATVGASRLLYRKLIRAGARIVEFVPCKLHSKLIVLDDAVYLGSANLDMRSLYLNLEIVLRIDDAKLADRMREFAAHYIAAGQEITAEVHRAQGGWFTRLRWLASWLLVAVIDYSVTRKLNLGLAPKGGD
ncbi:phosphatidylserine/phosphatidylglycerophosphate/cardiolipin synthase family protein [Altererythrobacter lauratis]|uniref:Phospholipase D n=1 Tax=Alteraurantiacibacter lauratis TaxID=2054627 RepID=A0ABV7ECV8_9SPHN